MGIRLWKERHDDTVIAGTEGIIYWTMSNFSVVSCLSRDIFTRGLVYYSFSPCSLNCAAVFVVCLGFSSLYSLWSLCWVSSMAAPPGRWARQWQLWWGPCCTPTLTGSRSSFHPGPSGQRFGGWSKRCPTEWRKKDEKMPTVEGEVYKVLYATGKVKERETLISTEAVINASHASLAASQSLNWS